MSFNITEEFDLDELVKDIPVPESNMYIADGGKAIELIADLIRNDSRTYAYAAKRIQRHIDDLFALFDDVHFDNELELYEQFMDLCARLSALQKIRKIQDKVVIGFGGAFSAGKSKFINSISGIEDILPVAQAPTTSIPTYIIKSTENALRANSIDGYAAELSTEAMAALTHEFYNVYGIGFSSFVDSIIVESVRFALPSDIALLDTPGYTKYDDKSDTKLTLSDRERAFEQLRASDYLIWLADVEGGGITSEDISFIESLRVKTPILIVFTKADLKTEEEIRSIVSEARNTVKRTAIQCFGITAYSSNENKEYGDDLIRKFLDFSRSGEVRTNDILHEFDRIEKAMRDGIQMSIKQAQKTARSLFSYISRSTRFLDIRSLVTLWGKTNQDGFQMSGLLKKYNTEVQKIKQEIAEYIRRCN